MSKQQIAPVDPSTTWTFLSSTERDVLLQIAQYGSLDGATMDQILDGLIANGHQTISDNHVEDCIRQMSREGLVEEVCGRAWTHTFLGQMVIEAGTEQYLSASSLHTEVECR